uniref:Uncharacterized protein n=1 Tax=Acrobeloides nanus TaxID=290746 RepID=A0A914BXA9_9BILA
MKKGDSGGGLYTLCGHFIGMAVKFDDKEKDGISMCRFNPATYMLSKIQDQGYALSDLNNFEANDYSKKDMSPPEDCVR